MIRVPLVQGFRLLTMPHCPQCGKKFGSKYDPSRVVAGRGKIIPISQLDLTGLTARHTNDTYLCAVNTRLEMLRACIEISAPNVPPALDIINEIFISNYESQIDPYFRSPFAMVNLHVDLVVRLLDTRFL